MPSIDPQASIVSRLLEDAVWALEKLGQGEDPGYAGLFAGIAALDALLEEPTSSRNLPGRDLMAAARCLLAQATEGAVSSNSADRERASALARMLWSLSAVAIPPVQ
jgi:hypothetical protein